MADDGGQERSKEDLTEEASPRRLEEYRNKGMVAQSRELTGLLALLATGVATYTLSPQFFSETGEFMREVFRTDLSSRLDLGSPDVARTYLVKALHLIASISLPISIAGFILGALGSYFQIGTIFTFEPLMPDFNKLNPTQGIKKLLSLKQFVEVARIVFKVGIVLFVSYGIVKTEAIHSVAHLGADPGDLAATFGRVGKLLFLTLIGILFVFAAIDYGFQKSEYDKKLRMTKQEAKQEHREQEGDPLIKGKIKAAQREMSRRRMMQAVKAADVIVTNPTHISIALVYDKEKMGAPRVVAKGADHMAKRIREIAREAGVPLVENVPLARTLYKTVKLNQAVPRALYQAVAEVLAHVYRLKMRKL